MIYCFLLRGRIEEGDSFGCLILVEKFFHLQSRRFIASSPLVPLPPRRRGNKPAIAGLSSPLYLVYPSSMYMIYCFLLRGRIEEGDSFGCLILVEKFFHLQSRRFITSSFDGKLRRVTVLYV
jgi:hypothetical protein